MTLSNWFILTEQSFLCQPEKINSEKINRKGKENQWKGGNNQ